jgi:prolyl oligopeptidase
MKRYNSLRRWLAPRAAVAMLAGIAVSASAQTASPSAATATDRYLWLEDVHGARAMAWVKAENAKTLAVLQTDPNFATLYAQALAIAQAKDRVPAPAFIAGQVYNFWQDDDHVRGIWRHTTPADYASASPAWTTTFDLDELAKSENQNWVWKGADCVWPAENRCLISLSDGGEDAVTVREFDLGSGAFVSDGFTLAHGKQRAAWEDADTLLVSREWSPGDLTASGYPFIVKRLKRGQPLSSAVEVLSRRQERRRLRRNSDRPARRCRARRNHHRSAALDLRGRVLSRDTRRHRKTARSAQVAAERNGGRPSAL